MSEPNSVRGPPNERRTIFRRLPFPPAALFGGPDEVEAECFDQFCPGVD
jgi:hypothetical protein